MYVGEDIRNWPEEAEPLKKQIQDFLAEAFNTYLENNGIKIQVEDNDPSEKPDLK
jgi:Lon protease-like protein